MYSTLSRFFFSFNMLRLERVLLDFVFMVWNLSTDILLFFSLVLKYNGKLLVPGDARGRSR